MEFCEQLFSVIAKTNKRLAIADCSVHQIATITTDRYIHSSCQSSYSADFAQFREHDDDVTVVLPQHPPEIFRRLCQGTLSCDVCTPKSVTLTDPRSNDTRYNIICRFHSNQIKSKTAYTKQDECDRLTAVAIFIGHCNPVVFRIDHLQQVVR